MILGCRAGSTHWLFPIVSRAPQTLITAGIAAGFDLTTGSSTLVALDQSCPRATHAMTNIVYVPINATMPPTAVTALAPPSTTPNNTEILEPRPRISHRVPPR